MTQSPLPENWQELTAGYTLGDLSPEEAEEFRHLLEAHPDLVLEVDQLQESLTLMPYALPEQEPPSHLRSKILEAAQSDKRVEIDRPAPRRNRTRVWLGLGGTIAALAIGALAIENYRLHQKLQESEEIVAALRQPDGTLYSLQGKGTAVRSTGSLVINRDQQAALILVQNLPRLSSDQIYRLWAVAAGAPKPAYCGQFNSDVTGSAITQWVLPERSCSTGNVKMLITVESASAPPVPAGSLVMQSTSPGT